MATALRPSPAGLPRAVWNFTVLLILSYITDLLVFISISLKVPWSISQIKQRQSSCMVNTNQSSDALLGPESPIKQGGGLWLVDRFIPALYRQYTIVCLAVT